MKKKKQAPQKSIAKKYTPEDAERIIRHLVISRKISGGTRSEKGSQTKSILTSIFDTWNLQNKNPLQQCQLLLANYQ